MNIEKDKYIILEIIPSHSDSKKGIILQIQALKLKGLELLDRFDYRVNEELIDNQDILDMLSYDKDSFIYLDNPKVMIDKLKEFIEDLPLLIIDNQYTLDYLKEIENKKESIFKYLNLEINDDVFSLIIDKYKLEPSNHLVDLLYEALIYESNKKLNLN